MDDTPQQQMPLPRIYVERTLALIKPDAIHKEDEIVDVILRSGFTILQKRKLQLSPEQCSDFYAEQYGKLFFPSLTAFMSSGPIIVLALARDQAIASWKALIGPVNSTKARETHPHCLRAKYGTSDLRNAVHGSDTFSAAEREIKFMFPNSVIEPIPMGDAAKDYLSRYVNPTLLIGLTGLCKRKPVDPFDLEGKIIVDELRQEVISTNSKAEPPQCTSLAWSADGQTLFAGYTDNLIRVWQVTIGTR